MYYIVRHGQTETNRKKALQGRSDRPLNEKGRQQAKALGEYFRKAGITFDAVYSSPLGRAIETAKLAAGEDAEVLIDERLIEMDYGPYEGVSLADPPPEIIRFFSDFVKEPAPEGMEPLEEVKSRLGEFLEELRGKAAGGRNILLSTHAIAMKGALEYLTPDSGGAWWSRHIANCALFAWDETAEGSTVPEEVPYLDEERG